ncbi:MAG: methylmalonyl Co-A mutase-associated GTPase MeaB [Cyclobacteriaceae bacterium]|nr:methylmalonyl Co-A mutase-associated GTPase MeaB [Cyclobacteriaceae bacterium]
MSIKRKNRLSIDALYKGVLSGDKVTLSRAITLTESTLSEDQELATELIEKLLPYTGNTIRIGITGVPGVGKSTFIEALGVKITSNKKKLAVLAIDPTSQRSGGSILGDKTRMETLSSNPMAYIRPSSSQDKLGGVANKTREAMLLCEAAGYEVIFIETVGVGQSEVAVKGMVDFFLLLMLAGAGDELQGIKKGIMEMADGIAITKADGNNIKSAKMAKTEYTNALHLFPPSDSGWYPKVHTCSSLTDEGIEDVWNMIKNQVKHMKANGYFSTNRESQNTQWMDNIIIEQLKSDFYSKKEIKSTINNIKNEIRDGKISPKIGANILLQTYFKK